MKRMLAAFFLSLALAAAASAHAVTLTWTPSTSPGIVVYNIYRAACPTAFCATFSSFRLIDFMPGSATSYTDVHVTDGFVYFYAVTAVDGNWNESVYSNVATVVIPYGPTSAQKKSGDSSPPYTWGRHEVP